MQISGSGPLLTAALADYKSSMRLANFQAIPVFRLNFEACLVVGSMQKSRQTVLNHTSFLANSAFVIVSSFHFYRFIIRLISGKRSAVRCIC
jgi:hypothetical protein